MAAEKRDIKGDYLAGHPDLTALADWRWPLDDHGPLIRARAAAPVQRDLLADELIRQNADLPASGAMLANIEALRDARTFTVATGHQVCLMGGPMFTLYKIATTIAMARDLAARHPQYRFVPVLWMATEDHDWEEVNHYYPAFGQKVVYPGAFEGPVGRHVLGEEIVAALPASLDARWRACFAPGNTMATAFRQLMHGLFGAHGLVILDADRPALKRLLVPHMARELHGGGMAAAVAATSARLEELGYKPQVHPREVNLFYIGDGGRSLIDKGPEGLSTKDGRHRWTLVEALAELEAHPEHFSPNVALRPVYQETLLPNLAYVGGWAEVGYWLQLRDGFRAQGAFYPLLVPRLHATLVTAAHAAEWDALGLPLRDLAQPLHVLNDRYLDLHWDGAPLEAALAQLDAAYTGLAQLVESVDPTLALSVKADQARNANGADNLRKKVRKALRNRQPKPYLAIAALKEAIEPESSPQQRTLNFTAFDSVNPLTLIALLVEHAASAPSESKWIRLP